MNLSRIAKFNPGELVKTEGYSKVGVVDHNSGVDSCWIKFYNFTNLVECAESKVRKITFKEFLWYTDPTTNGLKIGKNRAWPILFSLGMAIAMIFSSFTIEGNWKFGPLIIGWGIILLNYLGVRYNWTGRWV
jgi:hypothetical protein